MSWIDATKERPDADSTVLIHAPKDDEPVWLGYFDGESWRGVHGGVLFHQVTHWMDLPEPPTAEKGGAS